MTGKRGVGEEESGEIFVVSKTDFVTCRMSLFWLGESSILSRERKEMSCDG